MALWLWLLLLFSVLAILVVFYRHHKESSAFPPGFPRYPFIGSILSIPWSKPGSELVLHSTQFAPKYGKLMGYFLGSKVRLIIVQDFELAKEMMYNDVFSGRNDLPQVFEMRGINGRHAGIAFTHGHTWKANMRFSLSTLKDFGFGKKSIGSVITEEFIAVVETFKKNIGQDVLIHQQNFQISVLNIMWCMVAAKRFQHDDPQIAGFMKMLQVVYKYIYIDIVVPWVRYIYPEFNRRTKQHFGTMIDMFRTIVDDHASTLSTDGKPQDFIEAYLREMKANADLKVDDLVGTCMDLFEAGSDTVSSTLAWAMMYLVKYPDVQEKCYLELQSVIGGAIPTLDDRPNMPYCEATIMEIQRLSCAAPGGLEHRVLEDITIGGYNIPKGTYISYNIWKYHHDPEFFPDPWMFKPERFLSANGSSIVQNEHFVPFGFGKRMCMGSSIAKAQIFLFFSFLVKTLKLSMPKEHKAPSENEYDCHIIRSPLPFYVHMMARE